MSEKATATTNPRDFDNCAHVTRSGKRCGALRWYHADHARHKFVEPERKLTVEDERDELIAEVGRLREALEQAWTQAILVREVLELREQWNTRFNTLCGNCGKRYRGPRDEHLHGMGICGGRR